jgi:hypothetical protein
VTGKPACEQCEFAELHQLNYVQSMSAAQQAPAAAGRDARVECGGGGTGRQGWQNTTGYIQVVVAGGDTVSNHCSQ